MKKRAALLGVMTGILVLGGCRQSDLTELEQTLAAQKANRGIEGSAEAGAGGSGPFIYDEDGEPFFRIEAPEGFYINERYYVSNENLEFEYSPEDMDYVYQSSMSENRTENISTFSVSGNKKVENKQDADESLERIRETRVSSYREEGRPYSVYTEDDKDLGPFSFVLRSTREGYEQYLFYGVQKKRLITAMLTVPEETGEQEAIFDRTLEAVRTMTFKNPEEWEEPADQTQKAQTIQYVPYEKSSTVIPEKSYSFTVPALPQGFQLRNADALGYTVSKNYPELEKPGSLQRSETALHFFALEKDMGYFREDELRSRPKNEFENNMGEQAEEVEYLHNNNQADLGDFTTGVRTSYKNYERYLFVAETEKHVLFGRYFLPKKIENRQEIKELYEEAISSFDIQEEETQ